MRLALAVVAALGLCTGAVTLTACSSDNDKGGAAAPPPCVPDANEPNELPPTATSLGELNDDDDPGPGGATASTRIDKTFSTSSETDVDWYLVEVNDTGIGGNPAIRVMVSGGSHEVTAYFTCTQGTTKAVACGLGTAVTDDPDSKGAKGCKSTAPGSGAPPQLTMTIECDGTSTDSGRLQIYVQRTAGVEACVSYRLIVSVE